MRSDRALSLCHFEPLEWSFLQNQRSFFDVTITSQRSAPHRHWACLKADREAKTTRGILFDIDLDLHLQTYFENR